MVLSITPGFTDAPRRFSMRANWISATFWALVFLGNPLSTMSLCISSRVLSLYSSTSSIIWPSSSKMLMTAFLPRFHSISTPAYSSISPRDPGVLSPLRKRRNSLCLLRVHAGQLMTLAVIAWVNGKATRQSSSKRMFRIVLYKVEV